MPPRGKMNKPMTFDPEAHLDGGGAEPQSAAQRRMADMGFDSDEDQDASIEPEEPASPGGSALSSKASALNSGKVEELSKLLELESASLKAAQNELAESEQRARNLQRKFDQVKSATSGQMSFMRKKLEEQYQGKLDEMEAELDETRDESEALRVQIKMLMEHMEQSGGTVPTQLATAGSADAGDSRHVDKLKRELMKQGEALRRYEEELERLRTAHIPAASAGVDELKQQLVAAQAEVQQLRTQAAAGGGGGGGGGDSAQLQAEVAKLTRELKQLRAQRKTPSPTVDADGKPLAMTDDLRKMRENMRSQLAKSEAAAQQRAKGDSSAESSPEPRDEFLVPAAANPFAAADPAPAAATANPFAAAGGEAAAGGGGGPELEAERKAWAEKEAALGAEVKEIAAKLAAEQAKWSEELADWQQKETRWAAEAAQYKQGMGDEAKAAVESLEAERSEWEGQRHAWHEQEAAFKEKLAHAEAEQTRLEAALKTSSEASEAARSSGAEVAGQLAALTSEKEAVAAEAAETRAKLEAVETELTALKAELESKTAAEESLSAELAAEKEALAAAEAAAEEGAAAAKAKAEELAAETSKQQQELAQVQGELSQSRERSERQRQKLKDLKARFAAQLEQVRGELAAVGASNAAVRNAATVMKDDISQVTPKVQKRMLKHFATVVKGMIDQVKTQVTAEVTQQVGAQFRAKLEEKDARIAADHLEKRALHNAIQELKGNIRVFCRARPLIPMEIEAGEQSVVSNVVPGELIVLDPKHRQKKKFEFDEVFGADATQDAIFEDARQLVRSVCDGYNVCVFAYGQTGSGKTFTMEGTPEAPGVNYRALRELFKTKADRGKDGMTYTIEISLLEIYCDEIRDLLTKEGGKKLEVKQTKAGTHVPNLTRLTVNSYEEVLEAIKLGQATRATASTNMNEHSSRSHCMLQVYITAESADTTLSSKLNLIDLAGCERVSRSGATGQQLKEATSINGSLSALGDVIAALSTKSKHVPYRNSKLTYLLADSLGGDSKCLMFVNVSPAAVNAAESVNSLGFAARCRSTELGQAKKNVASK